MGRSLQEASRDRLPRGRVDRVRDAALPPDGVYEVDPEGSRLQFRAKAFTLAWVRGTMPVAGGTIRIADGRVTGAGELAADQITTGLAPRDWHLRSSHYLHTAKHPRIRVSVDDVPVGATSVPCTVVVRETSCVTPFEIGTVECAGDVLRVDGRLVLDRTPFPMLPPVAGVSRLVELDLSLRATSRPTS
jgi:polyisoprenoid-binding protein YceI